MNRPVHFEILAKDPERISRFYSEALGWTISSWEGQTYWLVTTGKDEDEGINGGIMGRHFDQPVINTLYVESLDDAIRRVEAAGGKKMHGPNEVPEVGMHAYCSDPEGTLFGLMEPKKSQISSAPGEGNS